MLSCFWMLLAMIAYSSCIPARDCPIGLYCPAGYTCKDSGECVDVCYESNATQQGNGITGRCEDVSSSNQIWLDSSLYEIFVYRSLNQDEIIKNLSLIVTYKFWNNTLSSDEESLNNITFNLTSSFFTLNTLNSTFEGFKNENTPEILRSISMTSSRLQNLELGDYGMKILVIWQDVKLAESNVVIHVVDPLPNALPVPVTFIQFTSSNYSVSSLDLSLKITLMLSGQPQPEPFDVFVIAKDTLSADSNLDFTPGYYIATFEPGATIATSSAIPILSESLDDSIEQFSLELYIPGASYKTGIHTGDLNKAIANIKDVSEAFINIGEDIAAPPFTRLTINCSLLISSLVPFNNITWFKDELGATNGSASNLLISQDRHLLILSSTLTSVGGQLGNDGVFNCSVCSNNGTCITRQSHVEVCRAPRLQKYVPITVHSKSLYGSSVRCGESFCIATMSPIKQIIFTCLVDVSQAVHNISVYKDNTYTDYKYPIFLTNVTIPHSLGMYEAVLSDQCGTDTAISTLSLCDPMIIHFDTTVFNGSESSGMVSISLQLRRHPSITSGDITVIIIPSNQSPVSAEGNGVDYNSTYITATFPAGINSTSVDVPVISDDIVERNETFQLDINIPAPAKYAVEVGYPSRAIAIITDASNSFINFHQSYYAINENTEFVQVEIIFSNPVSFDFTVMITHNDTSATGGDDYNSGPYNITIPAGETVVPFNVTIINDNINEENETFDLSIATTQDLPEGVHFGENLSVKILIEDNDAITVSFSHSVYEFMEEDKVAQVELVLSSPSSTDITIIIHTNDSSAISNINYIPGPYTITFPAGVTSVSFNISLLGSDGGSLSEFILYMAYSNETMIGNYSQAVVVIIHNNALYCSQMSDTYFGLNVIWERTPANKIVHINCIGNELAGMITRTCDADGNWQSPIVACVRKSFEKVIDKLRIIENASLSTEEKLAKTDTIAMVLANITAPQNESYFPKELMIAVNALSGVNNVTEKVIGSRHPNDTFFKDTTKALNNLLSSSNEAGWKELQQMSPEVNQMLVQSSENFGKILSQTLNNETSKTLEAQENIVIKAELRTQESINKGASIAFPDDSDNLTMFAGQTTKVVLPNELLKSALSNLSSDATAIPIVNMVFRDLSSILPNTSNESDIITSVISTQLPNPVTVSDGGPIVLTFKVINKDMNDTSGMEKRCVFYDYGSDGSEVGRWNTRGVEIVDELSNETIVTCHSTHLTSFAVLVSPQGARPHGPETKALSIISYIGCAISLFFLIVSIIILCYIMYGKPPNKRNPILIHLNLCIALALGMVVFVSGIETSVDNEAACKFVAALLQYLFTSAFCWMLCEGVMLYMMLITVFGNRLNNYLFFLALGWGPAIIIVAISVGIAHQHYGTDYYCWIKSDDGAIAAFIAPIGTIILINCIFFVMTLRVIYKNRSGNTKESFDSTTVKEILKAGMFLLPLLGLTWIIGILAVNNETQVFAWIFAILNSLQGLFIFIFHIARNKEVVAKFHAAKDRYLLGREGSSFYNRNYGSKRNSGTALTKSRESRSSASEMLPSHRKESTYSVGDNDVFSSNELKKNSDLLSIVDPDTKQVDPETNGLCKAEDVTVTNSKEEEVKILDNDTNSNEKSDSDNEKCDADKEKDKVATDDDTSNSKNNDD